MRYVLLTKAVPLRMKQGTLSHQAKVMQKCILHNRTHFYHFNTGLVWDFKSPCKQFRKFCNTVDSYIKYVSFYSYILEMTYVLLYNKNDFYSKLFAFEKDILARRKQRVMQTN